MLKIEQFLQIMSQLFKFTSHQICIECERVIATQIHYYIIREHRILILPVAHMRVHIDKFFHTICDNRDTNYGSAECV